VLADNAAWPDCQLGRRAPDKSIAGCTAVLASGPKGLRAAAFHLRGISFAAKGEFDRAISDITEGIRLDPGRAYRVEERGEIYLAKADYRRALNDLSEAISLDAGHAFRYHHRGHAYVGLGDYRHAIEDFTEAIRLDPVQRMFRFYDRGNAFAAAGQYDQAIADFDTAFRLEPNASILLNRGKSYVKLGKFDAAQADFMAISGRPDATPADRAAANEELAVFARTFHWAD
jgi:tetratricopeptide (TPR) repeat protein